MLITFSLMHYAPGFRYGAFANVGRWMRHSFHAPGLRFQKLMGSGRQFGLWPDWATYVFVAGWDNEAAATRFFASPGWAPYCRGTTSQSGTVWLVPFRSQGSWDGINPFATAAGEPTGSGEGPVAVLTRATVRPGALLDFWRHVPQARRRLQTQGGDLLFSIGVGEKPLVQQCTFSIWRSEWAVEQFAYRQAGHREVVRRTRQRRWYREELFARLRVVRGDGVFADLLAGAKQTTPP